MSLPVIPVCACCEKPSEQSISCTKCCRICCTTCFDALVGGDPDVAAGIELLENRICRSCNKINGSVQNKNHAGKNTKQDLCKFHELVCTLFCLNCSVEICGVCLVPGALHELHQVNNLTVVYREKVAEIKSKLAAAQKVTDDLHAAATVYRRNLTILQEEENDSIEEIEAIAANAISAIKDLTVDRIKTLEAKLKTPADHEKMVADLRIKVDQLSISDFLNQHPKIDEKCDELIAERDPVVLEEVDDIKCDLLSTYDFETIVFHGFLNTGQEGVLVSSMRTTHGVEWTFTVRKADMVQIVPSCKLPYSHQAQHMLIVIIPHTDYLKEIRQTFLLCDFDEVDVVRTSHIVEQKFCNDKGDLRIKIGVRPINAVAENLLFEYLSSSDAKRFHYNYLIMHFKPKLSEIQDGGKLFSLPIKDEEDRNWRMYVKLNSTNLSAFIQLVDGTDCSCSSFIELRHNDPKKTIVNSSGNKIDRFASGGSWGWSSFIAWDALKNDEGFHPNGILTLSFGVRPLSNDPKLPAVCSASA